MNFIIWFVICCIFYNSQTNSIMKAKIIRRIVGGKEVPIEDRPFIVSIQLFDEHHCGGSIISDRIVLTAAHCVEFDEINWYKVRSGSSNHDKGGNILPVRRILRHPVADLALLEVCKPFEINNVTCTIIEMFRQNEKPANDTLAVVSGWGKTAEDDFCIPDNLRSVSIPITDEKVCIESYESTCNVTKGQICAGYFKRGGKDACQKDSGGPLTVDGRLVGIVSKGKGCARPKFPGIYTEVAAYRNWIDKQIYILEKTRKKKKCTIL